MSTRTYDTTYEPPTPRHRRSPRDTERASLDAALAVALSDLPRAPQQTRSREKRASLLRAAARIFAERGYATTTADMIAEAAGVSIGTFYNYFRNKRQILLALVVEQLDDIFGQLRLANMDLSHDNARAHIRAAVAVTLRENDRSGLRRVWHEAMFSEPELIPYQQVIRRHTQERLMEQLQHAQRRGRAWEGLDVEVTALAILSLVDALSMHAWPEPGEIRIIDGVTDMIYRAIYASPS